MALTHLYKYRPINENTLSNLTKHQIWFPKPCEIDDPYDCAIHIERKHITNDELKKLFKLWNEGKLYPGLDLSQSKARYSTDGEPNEKFRAIFEDTGKFIFDEQREKIINNWGVASFSEIYDDLNMWALYADKHRGICLEFNSDHFFHEPHRVKYKAEIPAISIAEMFINSSKDSLRLMITTKAKCWAYQKEVRFFIKNGNINYDYDPKALTGVYFGLKTPESSKVLIFSILGKNFKNYYMMARNEDIYRLERQLI